MRKLIALGLVALLAACSEAPTDQSALPVEPVFSHGGGGAHLVINDQASCEGLGGGLTGEWFPGTIGSCVITGRGVLTAAGDEMIVSVWVDNLGHVTNNGDLLTSRWWNANLALDDGTIIPARFVNNGTVTVNTAVGVVHEWLDIDLGETDNHGFFTVEPGVMHWVATGLGPSPGTGFNNYGTYILRGELYIEVAAGSFKNHCGSTFIIDGGDVLKDPPTTTPCSGTTLDELVTNLEPELPNDGIPKSLHGQIAQVEKLLSKGKTDAAIEVLMGFIQHVEDLIADGQLTSAQGQPLIDYANAWIADLSA